MATVISTPGSKDNPHIKDPDAILDYSEDWTAFLVPVSDTISDVDLIISDPDSTLIVDPAHPLPLNNGLIATVWLTGGRLKKVEQATLRIHTVAGRTDDRTMFFKMEPK